MEVGSPDGSVLFTQRRQICSTAIPSPPQDFLVLCQERGMCVSIYLPSTPVTQGTQADRTNLRKLNYAATQQGGQSPTSGQWPPSRSNFWMTMGFGSIRPLASGS